MCCFCQRAEMFWEATTWCEWMPNCRSPLERRRCRQRRLAKHRTALTSCTPSSARTYLNCNFNYFNPLKVSSSLNAPANWILFNLLINKAIKTRVPSISRYANYLRPQIIKRMTFICCYLIVSQFIWPVADAEYRLDWRLRGNIAASTGPGSGWILKQKQQHQNLLEKIFNWPISNSAFSWYRCGGAAVRVCAIEPIHATPPPPPHIYWTDILIFLVALDYLAN